METIDYIQQYLTQCVACSEQLLAMLERERNALSNQSAKELENTAFEKKLLADIIDKQTKECSQRLEQEGYGQGPQSISTFIQQATAEDAQQELSTLWQSLQENLGHCQDKNRLNGRVLESSQKRIKQAIDILHGQTPDGELYGRAGKTVSDSKAHTLSRA